MAQDKKGAADLLAALYDNGAYTPLFATGESEIEAAFGLVGGQPVYAVCQNGGAVTSADVKRARKTLNLAAQTGNPVVTFYNSKGAKLEEGLQSLKAAAKLNAASAKLSGVVPQIAVVVGVCGASSALAAVGADLCIMTKDAELFMTAPFLSAAAGDKAAGAGTAQQAAESGLAAIVAEDAQAAVKEAAKLLMLLPGNNLSAPASFEYSAPATVLETAKYNGVAAVAAIADTGSDVELFKGFGKGVVTSLATVSGAVVGIVATNGEDTFMGRYCTARTARFVRMCDAFSIPVVTIVNTGGFEVSSTADAAGNIREAARLAATYADATTAKVAVITGKAVGTAYTALAGADLTIAMEGCVVAPVEPSAAVTILHKEAIAASGNSIEAETAALVKTYIAQHAGAGALAQAGLADFTATPATLRASVASALDILATKRTQRLPKKHGNMAL